MTDPFTELDALRQSITEFSARFDVRSLIPAHARDVVLICSQIEASISSVKALAAARSAESEEWKRDGYRSAADRLAHDVGMAPSKAKRLLDTGRALSEQPAVALAALSGELSPDQAALVADGAAVNPARAVDLIDAARNGSIPELLEEVARAKAEVVDREARRKAIHSKRAFRRWTDSDSAFRAQMYGNPEDGAGLWRVLDPIRRRLLVLRREAGVRDSLDALDYDAMMAFASVAAGVDGELGLVDLLDLGLFPQLDSSMSISGTGDAPRLAPPTVTDVPCDVSQAASSVAKRTKKVAFSPTRIMVRVDLDTILRGAPVEGELCEVVGYGPVAVSVIDELMANGNAFVVGVLTRSEKLLGVLHYGRTPNAHQKSALDFLYPSCAVKGCAARAGLQSDHRVDWSKTKFTVLDLLDRLCPHHHRLKTNDGWGLVPGHGKRDFVPPGDSRHPDRTRGNSATVGAGAARSP
jgi:hypothetical protein